jgi:hypothetical protein
MRVRWAHCVHPMFFVVVVLAMPNSPSGLMGSMLHVFQANIQSQNLKLPVRRGRRQDGRTHSPSP